MFHIFAIIAALLHILFFIFESLLWGHEKVNKSFKLKTEDALLIAPFAFNQGFYNLFLAISTFTGIYFQSVGQPIVANTLLLSSCLSMLGAGCVLFFSVPRLRRAACIQALPPLVSIIAFFV